MKDFLTKLYPESKKLNVSNTAEPKATNTSGSSVGNNDDSNKDDSEENKQDDV